MNILRVLPCWKATLLGGATELVYVFDDETAADHALGDEILAFFKAAGLEASVRNFEASLGCSWSFCFLCLLLCSLLRWLV